MRHSHDSIAASQPRIIFTFIPTSTPLIWNRINWLIHEVSRNSTEGILGCQEPSLRSMPETLSSASSFTPHQRSACWHLVTML